MTFFFPINAITFHPQIDHSTNHALDCTAAQGQAPTPIRRIVQVTRVAVTFQVVDLRPYWRRLQQLRILGTLGSDVVAENLLHDPPDRLEVVRVGYRRLSSLV